MNTTELIHVLSERLQLSKSEVAKRLEDANSVITDELVIKNNAVSCFDLGLLEIRLKNERVSVNPSNGRKMLIPPKLTVAFKASASLKEQLKGIEL